jgi:hypothetical protein
MTDQEADKLIKEINELRDSNKQTPQPAADEAAPSKYIGP